MEEKVGLRAEQAFYRHGLHKTKGRTGILILESFLEHRVHVHANREIDEHVPAGTWEGVVSGIIEGIHRENATDAICEAISRCGTLLVQAVPANSSDSPDELPNEMIQEP
jgi:putative membrane protein